ncbi:hypothetical protein KP79_PYT03520 [Mizuhopecten yessoensis]|uniref:Uncharacterized protein n=1 Tax=Mizuhopecten yessoensis TaxID=6573 RepID=A0A210QQV0_MIZYE|nr:hypothetical protein KP79_PYT03520 [Mizuhopecten yessoensis]
MSKVMVSTGCVSFVIFCLGIVSVFLGVARMYYVAVLALVTSLLFKLISILLWIPVRVSFDWDLRGEMYSALHAYYKTDNASPGIDKYLSDNNLGFNTLFYQGKCCLLQSSVFTTLRSTLVLWRDWPWTCYPCEYEKGVRWQILQSHSTAMCPGVSAYTEECTTTVLDSTLHRYDTTAVVFSAIMILLEVLLIIILDRAYKVRVDPKEGEQARGLFSSLFLNNRFINDTTMPKCKYFALGLCLFKVVSLLLEVIMTVGIILEKFEPGYFDGTEQEFLNDVFSGDISLGYVTHALGMLLLTLTVISFVLNLFTIIAVLRKWKYFLFALLFVTIVLWACNVVILGLLSRVLDVAYCCDKSPNCSYRTDTDSDSFQQFCTKVYHDKIHKVIGVSIAYVITMIILQVVCVVLSDRLYKRLQEQSDQDKDASGILSSVWTASTNNRFINQNRMPNFTNLAAIFMSFKGITMVCELVVSIGIILQKFSPDYFYTTEMVYLNDIYSGDLTLGYVIHVTAIVMFCVILLSLGLGVLGVIAVYKGWRRVMSVVVILTLLLSITEGICLGLLSLVLSVAYCCDYGSSCTFYASSSTLSLENLCKHGFQGAVYNVVGTFIGFIVVHLVLQIVVMGLADRIYKRVSTNLNKGIDIKDHGLFRTILRKFVNNRLINQEKMPDFTLMAFVYVAGNILMTAIDISAWIAILLYVVRYDSQLDGMYVGTLYLAEMTRGASITLLVIIPISSIFNVCKVVWCVIKYDTGLLWSTLPEILRLVVDSVILGLYAQLLESIRLSDRDIYRGMYGLTLAYLCVNIAAQLVLFAIKDRLHKRIETSSSVTDSSGLITRLWRAVVRHRFFETDSGKTNKTALGFCFLSCCLVVWEIAVWVAVLLQAESPGYLHGTFRTELGQEYDDDSFWRLLVTLLVLEWFYVIFHVVTVIAVIKRRRPFLYGASGLLSCILVSDLVTSGIASDWLDKAYNCSSSSKFCSTHVSKLYELCGVFIGLNIVHLCLVVSNRSSTHPT